MAIDDNCTICLENVFQSDTGTATRLSCMHLLHTDCIHRWQNRTPTCPNCRRINKQSRSSNHLLHDDQKREAQLQQISGHPPLPLSWPASEVPLQSIFGHPPLPVAREPPSNCGYAVANHPQMPCLQQPVPDRRRSYDAAVIKFPVLTRIAGLVCYLGDAVKKVTIGPGIPPPRLLLLFW